MPGLGGAGAARRRRRDHIDLGGHAIRGDLFVGGGAGIEAVPGVRGAGNRASGNGNPAQCLNVACGG